MFTQQLLRKSTMIAGLGVTLLWLIVGNAVPVVHAATITVNSTADTTANDGVCTLREAIINANNNAATWANCAAGSGADVIAITATGTITLGSALPDLTGGLTISGPGASNLTISGANSFLVFRTLSSSAFTFQDLTIANGSGTFGGGVHASVATSVTVNNVTFSGNSASTGGAIYSGSGGLLTVTNSTFVNNNGYGGAINNDGGATLAVTNSTFSGNTGSSGSAIAQIGCCGGTTLTNVTISANHVGSAIYFSQGTLTIRNSIVANSGGSSCSVAGGLTITNGGYNIDSGTTCGWGSASGSMSSTNPSLGALANNGGPTQTMALLGNSPARDKIPSAGGCGAGVATDQRGVTRPKNVLCDIGAYEYVPTLFLPLIFK